MAVTVINPVATQTASLPGSSRMPVRTLNQDDFLRLVLAQMTNQDPLSPMKDTEFVAQMAQFSALEQAKSMQQDISALRTEQQFIQANALLGRTVSVEDDQGGLVQGPVSAILVEAGTPKIVVNGQPYALSALLSVMPATNP